MNETPEMLAIRSVVDLLNQVFGRLEDIEVAMGFRAVADETWQRYASLGLSPNPCRLLGLLMTRELVTRPSAMSALYDMDADPPQSRVIDVYVTQIRKAVRPLGVDVDTRRMIGWQLARNAKETIEAALADSKLAA